MPASTTYIYTKCRPGHPDGAMVSAPIVTGRFEQVSRSAVFRKIKRFFVVFPFFLPNLAVVDPN